MGTLSLALRVNGPHDYSARARTVHCLCLSDKRVHTVEPVNDVGFLAVHDLQGQE